MDTINKDFPKEIEISGPSYTNLEIRHVVTAFRKYQYGINKWFYNHALENEFASWHNRKYGLLTQNCTSALHLILKSIGIENGDEVIVPDCTWIATTVNISHLGATPIFADIDKNNWCIDPSSIENSITNKTKAVIAVDLYGNMPQYEKIVEICQKYNLYLIEDAAEALGSQYKGIRAGKFGIGSTFSFHRTKTLSMGEGGILLIDNDEIYEKCKWYRDLCRTKDTYYNDGIGYKYVVAPQQAALGYAQWLRKDKLIKQKQDFLHIYKKVLRNIPDLQFNIENDEIVNGAWSTVIIIGKSWNIDNKTVVTKLAKQGIPARPFFYPLSSLPAYNQRHIYENKNTVAYDISQRGIHLPSALNLTCKQIKQIAIKIKNTFFT